MKKTLKNSKTLFEKAQEHVFNGFFWAVGVTLGFAFVSVIALLILSPVRKLPLIGEFVADVVYETQVALGNRTPQGYPTNNLLPQDLQNQN